MTAASPASTALLRGLALLLAVCAGAMALAAVAALPAVLERHVLADGSLGAESLGLLRFVPAGGLAVLTLGIALAARWLWRRAPRVPARRVRGGLVGALAGAVLAAAAAEVAARVLVPPDRRLHGDAVWIERWLNARRAAPDAGIDGTRLHRHDPDLGWAPVPGLRTPDLSVNAAGLRGAREHPLERPVGERRVVVVGDSFTFGEGVGDAEVYTERLEALLEGVRVVNLGVMGYGTDQQVLRLERDGLPYEPNLVVVGFYGPDAERNLLSFRDYAKPRFVLRGGGLELENVPIPAPESATFEVERPRSVAWTAVTAAVQRLLERTRFAQRHRLASALLQRALERAREHDARLLLAYFPARFEAFQAQPGDDEAVLARWAAGSGAAFVSLREVFRRMPSTDRARLYHGHWTPYGHEVVASALAAAVREDALLDPP